MSGDRPPCPIVYEDEDGFETGWIRLPTTYREVLTAYHVVPCNDLRKHQLDSTCWCQPYDEEPIGSVDIIVHNSADGREKYEPDAAVARHVN
jgi:hypothetical protein